MNFCFSVGQKQPMADVDPQSSTLESTCQSLSNQPRAGSGRSCLAQPKWSRKQTLGVRQADGRIAPEPTMDVNEVGQAVAHMANLPLSTNVLTMTIMATKIPFGGRG